jgi:alpha-galactosidase
MRRFLAAIATAALLLGSVAVATAVDAVRPRPAYALDNGLARTPPMGFNDWNAFGCDVSEPLITQTADLFVSSGLKAAGYQYVNIDDCWMTHERDADGRLVPDPVKFPHGIAWLADYVHARGLKLGIYEDAGTATCAGFPGSLGKEGIDAQTFADWGIDYLKYDNCNNAGSSTKEQYVARYSAMRDALARTGRPIVYSICEWGVNDPWTWAPEVGNLWRTTGDIGDSWSSLRGIVRQNLALYPFAKPGAWNDPDMLEVGNGGMTDNEYRTHFGMWAMLAAPLLIGTDLREATPATMNILLNREVIAIDQDPLGVQAKPIADANGHVVLARPLSNGDRAVALYNESDFGAVIRTTAAGVGLGKAPAYTLRDVWQHETTETAGVISAYVPAHGTVVYRAGRSESWANSAPSTDLSVDLPTAYPGAAISVVRPGTANPLATAFTNHGKASANAVSVSLDAPGWTVAATSPSTAKRLRTEEALATQWTVAPPADTAPGLYPLTGRATFTWYDEDGRARKATAESSATALVPNPPPTGVQALSDVPWVSATSFWGPVELDHSNGERGAHDGHTITIGGVTYAKGIGAHANSEIVYYLGGQCSSLSTDYGIDDEKSGAGDATWQVWADGTLAAAGSATWQDGPKHLDAALTGAQFLRLSRSTTATPTATTPTGPAPR